MSYEMWREEIATLNKTKYEDEAEHYVDPVERPSDRVFLNYVTRKVGSFCVCCRRDIAKPKDDVIDSDPEDDILCGFQSSGDDNWDETRLFARLSGHPLYADL